MKSKTAKSICCNSCGQEITAATALAKEEKRLARIAEEQAVERAADTEIASIRKRIKAINAKQKLIRLDIDEWCSSDSIKQPIEYVMFTFKIAGVAENDELSLKETLSMLSHIELALSVK